MSSRSARTRVTLQARALELFTERGFDATTVNDIAAAAGVSHMTFFRHFPTKESVLLDDPYDPVLAQAVHAQPSDLPALERVRRGVLEAWDALPEPGDEETRARIAIVAGHPGLRSRMWENNHRTEDVVVGALMDTGVERFEARVATAACLGALTAALLDWGEHREAASSLTSRITAALEHLRCPPAPAGSQVGEGR